MAAITGSEARSCGAPRSPIAAFKIREGNPVGASVTLARARSMYEFIDRLVQHRPAARVRDFRGVPTKSFDGRGKLTPWDLQDQLIFPEIDYSRVDQTRGMNITFVTTSGNERRGSQAPSRVASECRSAVRTRQ